MEGVLFMGVGKGSSIVVAILFLLDVAMLLTLLLSTFWPDINASNNLIARGLFLLIVFGSTNVFYSYLRGDDYDPENRSSDGSNYIDRGRKISVLVVIILFIGILVRFLGF